MNKPNYVTECKSIKTLAIATLRERYALSKAMPEALHSASLRTLLYERLRQRERLP
ncbi:MAG: hypothetical protein RMY34_26505 [Aulosira sp. DedQUE10]|nr:hypothetical protein [Aulosira sp. DedQUE10]